MLYLYRSLILMAMLALFVSSGPEQATAQADAGGDLDLVALDADGLGAVDQKAPERSLRLEADQQYGAGPVPQPALEMVADASGIAHAAGRNDDVKPGQLRDRLALVDRLREPQMRRTQQPVEIDARSKTR